MSEIRPFRAFRPLSETLAAQLASVPYDVINTKEARGLARGNPYSFLHVCRPEIDLDESTDIHAPEVYKQGAKALKNFIDQGLLVADATAQFYVYEQALGEHTQAGLVANVSALEYEQGKIKIHELTRKDKEDDRTLHVQHQNAHAEPVFLTYRAQPEISTIIHQVKQDRPASNFIATDGVKHTLWPITSHLLIQQLQSLFLTHVPALFVADGHHRTAAAVRFAQHMRTQKAVSDIPENWFMAVIFPHSELKILGYHRVVRDLNGLTADEFLKQVSKKFELTASTEATPAKPHSFGVFLNNKWIQITAKPGTFDKNDPIQSLDVSILQENLLSEILGITDPRTSQRIDFVGGIRGTAELERRCHPKTGDCAVAFCLKEVSIEQLMSVAEAGKIMPPKSTWFEPKLRSGLTVQAFGYF